MGAQMPMVMAAEVPTAPVAPGTGVPAGAAPLDSTGTARGFSPDSPPLRPRGGGGGDTPQRTHQLSSRASLPPAFRSPEARRGISSCTKARISAPASFLTPGMVAGGRQSHVCVPQPGSWGSPPGFTPGACHELVRSQQRVSGGGIHPWSSHTPLGPIRPRWLNPGVRAHSWGVNHPGGRGGTRQHFPPGPRRPPLPLPGAGSGHRPRWGGRHAAAGLPSPRHGAGLCLGFSSFGGGPWGPSHGGPRGI